MDDVLFLALFVAIAVASPYLNRGVTHLRWRRQVRRLPRALEVPLGHRKLP